MNQVFWDVKAILTANSYWCSGEGS